MVTSTGGQPALEIQELHKSFGKRTALDTVNIAVEPGEMVALIGPSGSGKSTLLKHIAGLLPGDRASGPIRIFGRTVQKSGYIAKDIRSIRSEVGFIFQQFNLVGRLPLLTNVLAGMLARVGTLRSLLGWFSDDEKLRAMTALGRVGLSEYASQRASTLSGGQQQRAAIARAMEQRARIILADEPIASLDPESARWVMEGLAELNRQDGVTVLVSLHQVRFAFQYCPRSIALKDGKVVYDGPSRDLGESMLGYIYGLKQEPLYTDGTVPFNIRLPHGRPAMAAAGSI
jgi:phosphonate transport system ATP-binding protein